MMRWALVLLAAATAFAVDDPWAKVKEIKGGAEIRIVKKGAAQPLVGKFGELTDESVIIVLKNEETAVHKEDIDRLDARPDKGSRLTKTGTQDGPPKVETPDGKPAVGMNHGPNVPGSSYNSGLSIGSKPDFEVVYRRPAGPPKK